MNESRNDNQIQLTDLEPQDEVKGGIGVDSGSQLTLTGVISDSATQGRGLFTISTDLVGPRP
jgi:hypothetical protein